MRGILELAGLQRRQWWPRERLEAWQAERLRRLVRHAAREVPLYRELYGRAGIRVDSVEGARDLDRLPIVRREEIQSRPQGDLVARGTDPGACIRTRTSGSTGIPLEILSRRRDRNVFNPSFFRAYLAWGLRPWHRMTYFQARPEKLTQRSWFEPFGVFRRQMLSSLDDPESWLEAIAAWRPHMIHGYSLTLKLLAEAAIQGNRKIPVPLVSSTSGVLDGAGRELIRTAFGSRIVDLYASEEAGSVMAWECPVCQGYHLCMDTVVMEVLRDGRPARPGEEGAVVVTNLSNFTMPLIRYDQGDVVRLSARKPLCGRGLPLVESVQGRAGDYVVLVSGRRLTPHPFFLVLDHALGVGRWQVVQESLERIVVRTTVAEGSEGVEAGRIVDGIRRLVGGRVEIHVEVVDHLREDPSRKLRSVISLVPGSRIDGV